MNLKPEYVMMMYFLYYVFSHMHFYVDIKDYNAKVLESILHVCHHVSHFYSLAVLIQGIHITVSSFFVLVSWFRLCTVFHMHISCFHK